MIHFHGSAETIHFANWVLHSGGVDPVALAGKAVKAVDMNSKDAAQKMREQLATLLEQVLAKWASMFAPGFVRGDDLEYAACQYGEANYGPHAFCLFVPLLTSAIERIDLRQAADHIFVHVGKTAKVAQ